MTDRVSIKSIRDIFDEAGIKVSYAPPEKLAEGEVSIRLKDLDLIIEDPYLYHLWVQIAIGFQMSDPDAIPAKAIEYVKLVEERAFVNTLINRGAFKFTGAKATQSGELYKVELVCLSRELINIDT